MNQSYFAVAIKVVVISMIAASLVLIAGKPLYAGKWKGIWYLRGPVECQEIQLDRKGRTTIGVSPKAVIDRHFKFSSRLNKKEKSGLMA